jgi:hypothetical protein
VCNFSQPPVIPAKAGMTEKVAHLVNFLIFSNYTAYRQNDKTTAPHWNRLSTPAA